MDVRVRLEGSYAADAGVENGSETTLAVDGDTVGDAVAVLRERFPPLDTLLVNSQGRLRAHVALTHDGIDVRDGGWLETPLEPGARLTVSPGLKGC
jgi:hypothetical protein